MEQNQKNDNARLLEEIRRIVERANANTGDGYMSIAECAAYIRCSRPHLYDLVQEGEIPHIRKGKRIIFSRKDIDAWMMKDRVKSNDEISSLAETMIQVRRLQRK